MMNNVTSFSLLTGYCRAPPWTVYCQCQGHFPQTQCSCWLVSTCILLSYIYLYILYTALKPSDIMLFFKEVSNQAYEIEDAYSKSKGSGTSSTRIPAVTVFLDEINTASCLGLLKEIIVDRSIDGTVS